jgi:hypothetical protein
MVMFKQAKCCSCLRIRCGGWEASHSEKLLYVVLGLVAVTEVHCNFMDTMHIKDDKIVIECTLGSRAALASGVSKLNTEAK